MRQLMMAFAVSVLLGLAVSPAAEARDIYNRIDECESDGGGDCVFDLLRELAGRGSRGGDDGRDGRGGRDDRDGRWGRNEYCECRQIRFEPDAPYNCWSQATWAVMRIVLVGGEERPQRVSMNEWITRACRGSLNSEHEAPPACVAETIEACR